MHQAMFSINRIIQFVGLHSKPISLEILCWSRTSMKRNGGKIIGVCLFICRVGFELERHEAWSTRKIYRKRGWAQISELYLITIPLKNTVHRNSTEIDLHTGCGSFSTVLLFLVFINMIKTSCFVRTLFRSKIIKKKKKKTSWFQKIKRHFPFSLKFW